MVDQDGVCGFEGVPVCGRSRLFFLSLLAYFFIAVCPIWALYVECVECVEVARCMSATACSSMHNAGRSLTTTAPSTTTPTAL